MIEEIYNRVQHLKKERKLRKYKGSIREIQRKNEYKSKKIRENRYDERKKL